MPTLTCTDKDGNEQTFEYDYEHENVDPQDEFAPEDKYEFRVFSGGVDAAPFQLTLKRADPQTYRVAEMHKNSECYGGKGIPDSLLPEAKVVTGCSIKSSKTMVSGTGEYRTPDATKVWNRLVVNGLANYVKEEDTFYLL